MEPSQVVGLAFLITGLAILLPTMIVVLYRYQFRRRSNVIKTEAYVVENIRKPGSLHLYPVIEFETEDGKIHQYTSKIGTNPPRVNAGVHTTIYYQQERPSKYQIKASYPIYFLGVFLTLFGLIISLIGLLAFIGRVDLLIKILNFVFE